MIHSYTGFKALRFWNAYSSSFNFVTLHLSETQWFFLILTTILWKARRTQKCNDKPFCRAETANYLSCRFTVNIIPKTLDTSQV